MPTSKKSNQGNVTLLSIVISAIIISFGVTVSSVLTTAITSVANINKSHIAYYQAEAGAEFGYYIFAGHLAGFQYTADNDATCEIESGEDSWCLQGRLNSIPEDQNTFYELKENAVLSVGLYNDISENPFEASLESTTNVALSYHDIYISIIPGEGADKTSNNEVGIGDMRITGVITTSDTYQEKTLVDIGHSDIGTKLLPGTDTVNSCTDQNYMISGQDLIWDSGEFLYRDIDASETVSIGDIRMVSTGSYGPGTTVITGDSDLGLTLNKNIINIGCNSSNPNYVYATDVAQIVISGQDDDGNKSIIYLLSKNQLSGKTGTNALTFDKNSLIGNVNYLPGSGAPSCSIVEFLEEGNADCANNGKMKEPQLQIYAFGEPLAFKIRSTFSDFKVFNSGTGNTLSSIIDIARATGSSTDYYYTHSSSNTIENFSIPEGTYTLSIREYGNSTITGITGITATSNMSAADLAINIQSALNGSTALSNQYSVNFRNNRFQIISTGITFTNPETTLISKGKRDNFEQSIKTSITDSSLVPIFGWYSVF